MREEIVIKGVNGELQLVLNKTANFTRALEQLKKKLESSSDFFDRNARIKLPHNLPEKQKELIVTMLEEYGLICYEAEKALPPDKTAEASPEAENREIRALVVSKTLRSGQKVVHDGSVVIIGDVNPGAQVIAGEDIIILGACRGVAHAGAYGNETATITANKILASQLRIAGTIARSPDNMDKPSYIETARIKNGAVVIEPAIR